MGTGVVTTMLKTLVDTLLRKVQGESTAENSGDVKPYDEGVKIF